MTFLPTRALARAVWLGAGLVVAAVTAGRVDVLLLAVPLLVHAAWAVRTRPASGGGGVRMSGRVLGLSEGESVRLGVRLEREDVAYTTVAWNTARAARYDPINGAVIDAPQPGRDTVVVFEPTTWGRYQFGPAQVVGTDAALAWRAEAGSERVAALVRPQSSFLVGGSGVARPIGLTGSHPSPRRGDGGALADVREFAAGDRLRRINWRVTSRTRRLHVNSTLTDRDTTVLIVTDTSVDVPGPDADAPTSLDATVRAVAAVTHHYLGFGDRVGLIDLGHRIRSIRPGTGPRQARIIHDALSRAERQGPESAPSGVERRVLPGTLVFFCSPVLGPDAVGHVLRLRHHGAEVVVIDTLPEGAGSIGTLARPEPDSFLTEAWVLQRMLRGPSLDGLGRAGIPVVAWRGPGSLAAVLLALEAARSAPRLAPGRARP